MSTFKVDDILGEISTDNINLPNNFTIGGAGVVQGYTSSGTEPSGSSEGDFWWDSTNEELYRFINGAFKKISVTSAVWYGDRDLRTGVGSTSNEIHYNTITTLGNAADFGDLTQGRTRTAGCSNQVYSYRFGGSNNHSSTAAVTVYNTIDVFANGTLGNATDFGDTSTAHTDGSAHSNGTTGVVWQGMTGSAGTASNITDTIDKYTLSTTGSASDFGNLSIITNRWNISDSGCGNATRGIFWGGTNNVAPYTPIQNYIDYITVASPGNSTDFGDMAIGRYAGPAAGAGTDDRALYFGGYSGTNQPAIDYITVSTTGNAADFGDLTSGSYYYYGGAAANTTRAVYHASYSNNAIHYVTMSTPGNSVDFGDQIYSSSVNTLQTHSSGNTA